MNLYNYIITKLSPKLQLNFNALLQYKILNDTEKKRKQEAGKEREKERMKEREGRDRERKTF